MSEGEFVMSRPMADHNDPKAVDESTDAYDTVAWLLANISGHNGRAGFVGTSYDGFLAMAAGIDPHPAVKAISPQAPMIDVWMGDDFFHNGAFRQSYGYDYVYGLESSKETTDVEMCIRDSLRCDLPDSLWRVCGSRSLAPMSALISRCSHYQTTTAIIPLSFHPPPRSAWPPIPHPGIVITCMSTRRLPPQAPAVHNPFCASRLWPRWLCLLYTSRCV